MKRKKQNRKKSGAEGSARFLALPAKLILRIFPIALAGGIAYFGFGRVREALYADPLLDIRTVKISPANALAPELKNLLERKWIGTNILSADLEKIAKEVSRSPEILRAEVVRELPSTLAVQVKKRTPFASLHARKGDGWFLVSEDAMVLASIEGLQAGTVELEALAVEKTPVPGQILLIKGFDPMVTFLKQFKKQAFVARESLSRLSLDYLGNLTILFADGPAVKLGNHPVERIPGLYKLAPFLEAGERHAIDYIDLQFKDVVVKRRRK